MFQFGARMLSTFMDPFTLTFTDFAARLTSPALLDLLRDMLDLLAPFDAAF